jgi:hypothetical protein
MDNNLLIINDVGDLMLLEIFNEELKKQTEQISTFILEAKNEIPQMDRYEEKKNILIELITNGKLYDEEIVFLKNKFVSINI